MLAVAATILGAIMTGTGDAVLADGPDPEVQPSFEDIDEQFATLDKWRTYSYISAYDNRVNDGYAASIYSDGEPERSVLIAGDGFKTTHGIQRSIDVSSLKPDERLYMGVDFRAVSDTPERAITNASFDVRDENGTQIYHTWLVLGGTTDSGWRSFEDDFTDVIDGRDTITVRLMLRDGWIADYNQRAWYDNFYASTEPRAPADMIQGAGNGTTLYVIVDDLGKLERLERLGLIGCDYEEILIERVGEFYRATYFCNDEIDREKAYGMIVEGSEGAKITEEGGVVSVEIMD